MELEWTLVTPARVYRRSEGHALSKLVEKLKDEGVEIWGFVVERGNETLFSWDPRRGEMFVLGQTSPAPKDGTPFCYALRRFTAGTNTESTVWEFGVQPHILVRLGKETEVIR